MEAGGWPQYAGGCTNYAFASFITVLRLVAAAGRGRANGLGSGRGAQPLKPKKTAPKGRWIIVLDWTTAGVSGLVNQKRHGHQEAVIEG